MKKRILSFALAAVMVLLAVPMLAFSATAEEADVLKVTWDQSNPDVMEVTSPRDSVTNNYVRMYIWYDAEGNLLPVDGYAEGSNVKNEYTCMEDDCYAVVNPELYTKNILTEDMTVDEVWDAYAAYLKTCGRVTYKAGWELGNIVGGEYILVKSRCFMYGATVYGVRQNSKGAIFPTAGGGGNSFVTTYANCERYFDDLAAKGKTTVQPGDDKKIYWSEIKDTFLDVQVLTYEWNAGAGGFAAYSSDNDNYNTAPFIYYLRPDTHGPISLRYTVPEETYGTATVDFGNDLRFYSGETQGLIAMALNGEVVWPVGADYNDKTSWAKLGDTTNLKKTNEALAAIPMNVRAGDEVELLIARDGSGKIAVDFNPSINIEKKYLVEFVDKDDNLILDTMVTPGGAMPEAPVASKNGFFINGATEAVTELPATVTANTTVKYAGDFDIAEVAVEQSSIAISTDFKATLYLKGDPKAKTVGYATDEGEEVIGVLQEDGLYKITVPGIAAKDLDTDVNLYLFQEFEGGVDATNAEPYVFNAKTLLETYVTDEQYADVKPLAAAALDYAAAAKAYWGGEELDAAVVARLSTFDAEIADLAKDINLSGSGTYNIARATLVLTEKVALKIGVETEDCVTLEAVDLGMTVRVGEEEYTGFTIQQGSEGTCMVITLGGVGAKDFDTVQEITVIDGLKRKSGTLSYSVNTYIARTFEGGEGETDNLLRALYALGVAANA